MEYMKRANLQNLDRSEITAIDRRSSAKPKKTVHSIQIIRKSPAGIIFQTDWKFLVPACRRRFYFCDREMMVEESGKIPGRDIYQFTGIFIRKH
jgi:hypothetical protein